MVRYLPYLSTIRPFITHHPSSSLSRPTRGMISIATIAATLLSTVAAETSTQYIYHSHVFHAPPHNVIDSILSNARVAVDGASRTVLDIDASSSRLDDGALSSLVERLTTILDEESDDKESHAETADSSLLKRRVAIKLALGMNQLTPSGASKLFDRFANVETSGVGGNKTASDDRSNSNTTQSVDSTINEDETMDANETTTATADENATATNTILQSYKEEKKQEEIPDPSIELEELDLSFNDIGGHGTNAADLDLLNSVRRLFERGLNSCTRNSLLVPRVLTLENCGIGPAFCRSIGRVSASNMLCCHLFTMCNLSNNLLLFTLDTGYP